MNIVDQIKQVISKIPHSESRVPYTYHHDYLRQTILYKNCSRGEIAELKNWDEDQLYAAALCQIIDEIGVIGMMELESEDMAICRQAMAITKDYINSLSLGGALGTYPLL